MPARYVGCRLPVKADSQSLTIYHQDREVVTYARCWRRGQTLGAERFEKELLDQRPRPICREPSNADYPKQIGQVELLGHAGKLPFERQANGLVVTLPEIKPNEFAYVLKIRPT